VLDPATVVGDRAGLRLALVAALQHLPARQRAVLILRDVLAWPAAEVAGLLDLSVPAVKSALQRARGTVHRLAPEEAELIEPAELRAVVDRYAAAFERADPAALAELLRADVTLEMPPLPESYAGRDAVTGFFAAKVLGRAVRMVPTTANGQPALATYLDGAAHAVHVLDVAAGGVAGIVVFLDPGLPARFGLPPTI
jgi:RNA polymerase sigma-70 factor (ECF subfamily)